MTRRLPNGRRVPSTPASDIGSAPVLNIANGIVYSTQVAGHSKTLNIKYWTNCAPRPTIFLAHAGGWKGFVPDDTINGAVGAFDILAALGFNVVNPNYWGYDDVTAYNFNRPRIDLQNGILWCRDAGNAATYNLNPLSVNALGHSAGGQLLWLCTMIGTTGTTRPDTMCSWSGPNHHEECVGTFAGTDAQKYVNNLPFGANMATWRTLEPGVTPLVNPGIPGRCVASIAEDTVASSGVAYTQQTQLVTAAAGIGYIITLKPFSIAGGYSRQDLHYNFCGDPAYGGDAGINDIVDLVVPGSGYVAWLASLGIVPT